MVDVLKRWEVLKGDKQAALLTGTDEHGMKVQKAAKLADKTPQELCDQNAEHFRRLANAANVLYDRFIRTTDPDHKDAVRHFWTELNKRGYIYESKHEGWYSISDETFYPESQIHLIQDPATGRKMHASKETGKEVEWTSEINYRFKLSAFKDRLLEHYEQHPTFIVPNERFNFIKAEVAAGLNDLSISRPSSRLDWGIRVPEDDSQTIYVWLDALINYITMTGYPSGAGDKHKLWPPNVQVIGKDIVRFHTIYWPAFLMALDIPLPRAFLTHAHWTLGKAKMSKSSGNGVNPFSAIQRFGLDTIRYFMIHDGGIVDDADYENTWIAERYRTGLQGKLGNLHARLVRAPQWTIGTTIQNIGSNPEKLDDAESAVKETLQLINATPGTVNSHMLDLNPRAALRAIMQMISESNRVFGCIEPWTLAKQAGPEACKRVDDIVYTACEALRVTLILLQPFIPEKAKEGLDRLKVSNDMRNFEHAVIGADTMYGQGVSEHELSMKRSKKIPALDRLLFPPLINDS